MCDKRIYDKSAGFSYARVLKLLDRIDRETVGYIRIIGGEPLLDKISLLRLIKKCSDKNIEVLITTNGSLLSKTFLDAAIRCGLKRITLSVDAIGTKHDKIRNLPGLFNNIQRMVVYLRLKYPLFRIHTNTVFMNKNARDVYKIAAWGKKIGISIMYLCLLEDFGKNYAALKPAPDDLLLFRKAIDDKTFGSIENEQFKQKGGCKFLLERLNVRDDGKIIPCRRTDSNEFYLDKDISILYRRDDFRGYILDKVNTCRDCF
jgi:MoaA/NifB/PqqE/SkfB family radical SAM enzyme